MENHLKIDPEAPRSVTFDEWIREALAEVDPDVTVSAGARGDLIIKINGQWPLATVYGPPIGVFGAWLDEHPRGLQTPMFRKLAEAINAWYGLIHEQEMREVHGPSIEEQIVEAAKELINADWPTRNIRYVPSDKFRKLQGLVDSLKT